MSLPTCRVRSDCRNTCPPGMSVCSDCGNDLALTLLHVLLLGNALEDAHIKSMRFSVEGLGRRNEDESPVPFNPRASRASAELLAALTEAADFIAREREYFRPMNTFAALARFLAAQVSWIRAHHDGPAMVQRLHQVIDQAARVVDRPADVVALGRCGVEMESSPEARLLRAIGIRVVACDEQLYALANAETTTCRACRAEHEVKARRAWLLGAAEEVALPAKQLARAVDGLGVAVTPMMIDNWSRRGRLVASGTTTSRPARPTYRVGDVLDIVNADRAKRDEKIAAAELATGRTS